MRSSASKGAQNRSEYWAVGAPVIAPIRLKSNSFVPGLPLLSAYSSALTELVP